MEFEKLYSPDKAFEKKRRNNKFVQKERSRIGVHPERERLACSQAVEKFS